MEGGNNFVDISSLFFFEATGDSESDSVDPNIAVDGTIDRRDDDDAESCSYDSSDFHIAIDEVNDVCCDDSQVCIDDNVEEGDEAHSYVRDMKSNDSVDSSREELSEMDKNKQFWETCLAS